MGELVVMADPVAEGRESFHRQAWRDAFDHLSAADQQAPLDPDAAFYQLAVAPGSGDRGQDRSMTAPEIGSRPHRPAGCLGKNG
jgi:hypothetical protein